MQCKINNLVNGTYLDGKVITFNDETMMIKCKWEKRVVLDSLVHIHITNPLKGEIILCGVVNSIIESMIKLINVKCIEIRQKRKDARVKLELVLYVNKIQVGESKLIDLHKKLLLRTVDISAGGIMLCSQLDIPMNIRFCLELPIGETISCIAQIVRKEKKEDGFYYGCRLMVIGESKKDKIREFVFKKQIEEYKNKPLSKVIDF